MQPAAQVPPLHAGVIPPQTVPHLPQFFGSLVVSVQLPPQTISPIGQAHAALAHNWPIGQAMPHLPQSAGSLARSTHIPAQKVVPFGQLD